MNQNIRDIEELQRQNEQLRVKLNQANNLHMNMILDLDRLVNHQKTICDFKELEPVKALYRDAIRYRWYREPGEAQHYASRLQEAALDAAIDKELGFDNE